MRIHSSFWKWLILLCAAAIAALLLVELQAGVGALDRDRSIDASLLGDYIGRAVIAWPALVFAVLVIWFQPVERAYRSLAAMFLCAALAFYSSFIFSPPDSVGSFGRFLQPSSKCLLWYFAADFARHYGTAHAGPLRSRLDRIARVYRPIALLAAAYGLVFASGFEAPLLWALTFVTITGGCALLLLSLLDGWRASRGQLRERYRWLVLAVSVGAVPAVALNTAWIGIGTPSGQALLAVFFVTQVAMYCLLTYAVLRYRVFDFYLAIRRTVGFGIVSVLIMSLFSYVSHAIIEHLPEFEKPPRFWHTLLAAAPAVLFFLMFSKLHHWVEHRLHALFFRHQARKERELNAWCSAIAHVSSTPDLLASMILALDRFAGGSGTAVYRCGADNAGELAATSLSGAPQRLAPDEPVLVTLRADLAPAREHLAQGVAGLALPMSHRGLLHGLVLVGARADGECYGDDEIDRLRHAVTLAGLALHALRVEELQGEVTSMEESTERMHAQLQSLAGRRHVAGVHA